MIKAEEKEAAKAAKTEEKEVTPPEVAPVAAPVELPMDERDLLWQEFCANYQKANPVKYAQKRAMTYTEIMNGVEVKKVKPDEMAFPPVSFKGKKEVKKLASGEVRVSIY